MRLPAWLCFGLSSVAAFAVALIGHAAEEPASQILFVQVRVKDGAYSIVSATNVSGALKTRRGAPREKDFQLVLEDKDGRELWTDSLADPTVRRLEYEDPARPGVIQVKEVKLSEAEFTVRAPARAGRRHLAIYRRSAAPAAAPNRNAAPSKELVTRLLLPTEAQP